MNINWTKIIEDSLKTVIAALIIAAAAIVWKGATTVESKVSQSKDEMQHLINGVSDELATLKVRINTLEAENKSLVEENKGLRESMISWLEMTPDILPPSPAIVAKTELSPPPAAEIPTDSTNQTAPSSSQVNAKDMVQQKALKSELLDKLQYKK